ncbi:phosphinothricin acetyltransferase [Muriicola jejuensis]|uniref:GNAT family N-acetyltransferase n=1 Tax=Muriicola jejuensis TaxID=504488 RepID=A0A6P0U9E9_9FLAO|nr:GNAT family N-acetyltransferase [Muriicola jejuensis]NER09657.1 GNAT family N-acetyltransferase [Muriicola jejuensis]SMP06907.1 phosphinothricin acetyltransferase [Muriicola jejuensis]
MEIRTMTPTDWPEVARIYAEGIATGFATFEKNVPPYDLWDKAHIPSCRLIASEGKTVCGWAALSPVSGRCVYGGVAEVSVYVGKDHRGKGIGKRLLESLIAESEREGFWTLQSGIFPENESSVRIHLECGFRKIGHRERIGRLDGVWKDNLIFERRSPKVGVE